MEYLGLGFMGFVVLGFFYFILAIATPHQDQSCSLFIIVQILAAWL